MRDIVHNIGALLVVPPAVQAATVTSATVDLLGFDSVAFLVNTGAIVGSGNFTAKVQASDTDVDANFVDVPANLLQGALPPVLTATSSAKVGYRGFKRYVRIVLTKNSGTSIAADIVAIKSHAVDRPVA